MAVLRPVKWTCTKPSLRACKTAAILENFVTCYASDHAQDFSFLRLRLLCKHGPHNGKR